MKSLILASKGDIPLIYELSVLTSIEDYLIKIVVPVLLMLIFTFFIGFERQNMGKSAGLSAHTLVGISSVGISIVQRLMFEYNIIFSVNPVQGQRIIAQVVTGIGFLGAGVIMKDKLSVKGLTTAATIWTTAILGIIFGSGYLIIGSAISIIVIGFITIRDLKRGFNPLKPYKNRSKHAIKYSFYDNEQKNDSKNIVDSFKNKKDEE